MVNGCEARVESRPLRVAGGFPCPNNAKVNRDGKWYCLRHDPVRIKQRERERDRKIREKDTARDDKRRARVADREEELRRLSRYDEAISLLRDYETVFGCTEDATFAMRVRKFLSEERSAEPAALMPLAQGAEAEGEKR